MSLLEITRQLLGRARDAGVSLREIADASGGTVQHEWLRKFNAGKIPDPSANRIQSLHDCLRKMKIKAAA